MHPPSARTADQTEIALFGGKAPAEVEPDRQNGFRRQGTLSLGERPAIRAAHLWLLRTAIAMVATKSHYSYWRPVTAIQAGDTDGNPNDR
jgi:hypothetical protein